MLVFPAEIPFWGDLRFMGFGMVASMAMNNRGSEFIIATPSASLTP
jgi:hypothetical protein